MPTPLRVLILEDNPADAELMLHELRRAGFDPAWQRVETEADYLARLDPTLDLILADYSLPQFDGLRALQLLRAQGLDIPFIIVSGSISEEVAVECMKQGAADYLLKDRLARLGPAVAHALEQKRLREERQRAEERLRESEERFRSVAQSAPDAILIANGSGQIISWNKGAQGIFGYAPEEVMGKPIAVLMPERYRDAHKACLERFRSTGETRVIGGLAEFEGLRKDGSVFPLELSLANWQTREGYFFSAVIRDITDRKHFEMKLEATVEDRTKDLRVATRKAEAASRHKSEFLANMSHELRTPLNSVIGFAELLQDPTFGALGEKQARYAHNIQVSGRHLLALINDLLDLSKVEAGKLELRCETVNLAETLEAALLTIRPLADHRRLTLTLHAEQAPATLTADPLRLTQILYNLLSNAVKFTPEGGQITVTAKVVPSSECQVPGIEPGTWNLEPGTPKSPDLVEISMTDAGIGITADDLLRLFQPFTQLEPALVKHQQGTGLGLSLTKHLVELHGGMISAASPGLGHGSTFTVRLPLQPQASPELRGKMTQTAILVVEDDQASRELVVAVLAAAGHTVLEAEDGRGLLERVKRERPNLILMDLQLPRIDGFTLTRQLKADAETREIPVLAATAYAQPEQEARALEVGCAGYLTKPLDTQTLLKTVARILDR